MEPSLFRCRLDPELRSVRMTGATHVAGGTGGQVGMCHTCMSPSTTRVLVPKFVGVWILLCSSVGVGAGGAVGAGRGVAGGIGVGAGGGCAHATIANNRQAASSTTTPKFLCDSMNSPSSNSSQRLLHPEAIIDAIPLIPIESLAFAVTSLRVR